jgi:hypothetical protein
MFQLKHIPFPVDFSRRSRGAAAYVEVLAGRFQGVCESVDLAARARPGEVRIELRDTLRSKEIGDDRSNGRPAVASSLSIRLIQKSPVTSTLD